MRHAFVVGLVVLSGCAMQTEAGDVEGQEQAAVEAVSCRVRGMGALEGHEFFVARARAAEGGDAHGILVHFGAPAAAPVCDDGDEDDHGDDHRYDHHDDDHGGGHGGGHHGDDHHGDDGDDDDCDDDDDGYHGRRDHFVGHADGLRCRVNGSEVADVEGTGSWNGEGGHVFRLRLEELADPNLDFYRLTVLGPDGALVYTVSGDVVAGRITVLAEL